MFKRSLIIVKRIQNRITSYSSQRRQSTLDDEKLSKSWYWSQRYVQESHREHTFDWFVSGEEVHDFLAPYIVQLQASWAKLTILDLGCGNSSLSSCLFKNCNKPVELHLTDYIGHVLQTQQTLMRRGLKGHPETHVHYVQCDVTRLPYKDNCFHLVVDKGTTDALLKDRAKGQVMCKQTLADVVRVLQNGGMFLQVTDEDPDVRLGLLETILKDRSVSFRILPSENKEYFAFVYFKQFE